MAKSPKSKKAENDDDQRTPKEAAELRDATLRTMLKTPPKPHKGMVGQPSRTPDRPTKKRHRSSES